MFTSCYHHLPMPSLVGLEHLMLTLNQRRQLNEQTYRHLESIIFL